MVKVILPLFILWIIVSQELRLLPMAVGLGICFLAAGIFSWIFRQESIFKLPSPKFIFAAIVFLAKLFFKILLSNIKVMKLVLSPSLPVAPLIIKLTPDLSKASWRLILANSVTLTPGTLAVDVTEEGAFYVHCLNERAAHEVKEVEKIVKELFREAKSG